MEHVVDFDIYEKADFYSVAVPACANCKTTASYLTEYVTDEGPVLLLCEDCAEEEARMERKADQLALAPSCEARQMIIDHAETTRGLVGALVAHDQTQCVHCASNRMTVQTDRLYVHAAAVCCEGEAA